MQIIIDQLATSLSLDRIPYKLSKYTNRKNHFIKTRQQNVEKYNSKNIIDWKLDMNWLWKQSTVSRSAVCPFLFLFLVLNILCVFTKACIQIWERSNQFHHLWFASILCSVYVCFSVFFIKSNFLPFSFFLSFFSHNFSFLFYFLLFLSVLNYLI